MEKLLGSVEKEVLVDMVKLAQKQGMKGAKGGWKEFLDINDRKFGAGLSDPQKRSIDVLVSFLKTFPEEDSKLFSKVITCHSNKRKMEELAKDTPDIESPEQRLVRLTCEHPSYRIDYSFPSYNEGWVITNLGKLSKLLKSKRMIAIDCEMVLCQDGTEEVVRVCAVDREMKVKLDALVNPNKDIADYRTEITGVSKDDLNGVTFSLEDVQKVLKKLLGYGSILVGHSLNSDLRALKIDHVRVIDTSLIFKCVDLPAWRRPSLNSLCKSVLGYEVRKEGAPHNCLEDARAAMKLVLAKLEFGFDHPITLPKKEVTEDECAKLFLHGIPLSVPPEELAKIFPEYGVKIQSISRVRSQKYSTYAVFSDAAEAHEAYGKIGSKEEKDSYGKRQKPAMLQSSREETVTFYVQEMSSDDCLKNSSTLKRSAEDVEDAVSLRRCNNVKEIDSAEEVLDVKRLKRCNLSECSHAKEVDRLKRLLQEREDEIFSLQKILAALAWKNKI